MHALNIKVTDNFILVWCTSLDRPDHIQIHYVPAINQKYKYKHDCSLKWWLIFISKTYALKMLDINALNIKKNSISALLKILDTRSWNMVTYLMTLFLCCKNILHYTTYHKFATLNLFTLSNLWKCKRNHFVIAIIWLWKVTLLMLLLTHAFSFW